MDGFIEHLIGGIHVKIIYLQHSGFVVETEQHRLIFDYYQDPAASVFPLRVIGKTTSVFCSHKHGDHFNPQISKWAHDVERYYLSDDIEQSGGLSGIIGDKVTYMKPYEQNEYSGLKVVTYGSTDEGLSFYVEADGWRIFHAGDLNWWHWKGDTDENNQAAAAAFRQELKRFSGLTLDVVFFPVDSRLAEYRTLGVEQFCLTVKVKQLVTMHGCGEVWTAPANFPAIGTRVPVWSPAVPGATLKLRQK